jgi:hypothetical protein
VTANDDELFVTLAPDSAPDRPEPISWDQYRADAIEQWHALLARDPEELEVQQFLELHPSMVPGGSGDVGPGGHHGSELRAMFRLPELKGVGRNFLPDFMWVTRSSGLITPILVEIEKPSKRWFRKDGVPTAEFTQARNQLNQWRTWFGRPGNLENFRQRYLFDEDYRARPLEPQYVLVYGRASEFEPGGGHKDPEAMRSARDSQRSLGEVFRTFDSLYPRYDSADSITATMTVDGPRAFALSPTFGTDSQSGIDALILGDLDDALKRTVMMSEERKTYLAGRWEHWRRVEERVVADRDRNRNYARRLGKE